jgi:hypothetical protein
MNGPRVIWLENDQINLIIKQTQPVHITRRR